MGFQQDLACCKAGREHGGVSTELLTINVFVRVQIPHVSAIFSTSMHVCRLFPFSCFRTYIYFILHSYIPIVVISMYLVFNNETGEAERHESTVQQQYEVSHKCHVFL